MYTIIFFAVFSLTATWMTSQGYKLIIAVKIFKKKISLHRFMEDGNFPSTHSAVAVSLAYIVIFILLYEPDKISALITAVITLTVFETAKTLRDACGHRHRQDVTNNILYILLVGKADDSIKKEAEKEANTRVGHKPYEVLGGALLGVLTTSYMIGLFFVPKVLFVILPISVFYFWFFFKYVKRKAKKTERRK